MIYKIDAKDVGVGTFEDGKIYRNGIEIKPIRTEKSQTGNHWRHIYENIEPDDVVVRWGYTQGGKPWYRVTFADDTHYPEPNALKLAVEASGDNYIG